MRRKVWLAALAVVVALLAFVFSREEVRASVNGRLEWARRQHLIARAGVALDLSRHDPAPGFTLVPAVDLDVRLPAAAVEDIALACQKRATLCHLWVEELPEGTPERDLFGLGSVPAAAIEGRSEGDGPQGPALYRNVRGLQTVASVLIAIGTPDEIETLRARARTSRFFACSVDDATACRGWRERLVETFGRDVQSGTAAEWLAAPAAWDDARVRCVLDPSGTVHVTSERRRIGKPRGGRSRARAQGARASGASPGREVTCRSSPA